MNPNPLYMLMKNMTQRAHGPRPYDGILGAAQEKVVAYEGDDAGTKQAALQQARDWVDSDYMAGVVGTLIEIRVVGTISKDDAGIITASLNLDSTNDNCDCTSGRRCASCLMG